MMEIGFELLAVFVLIAIFAEAIWESIKLLLPEVDPRVDRAAVIILAIFMCVATGSDLFKILGIHLPWSSGAFFSGILCSRGANFLHDLFKRAQGEREAT